MVKTTNKLLWEGNEWSFEIIERVDREIARIADNYKLDTYPNQIEVITSDQMLSAYSSVGLPVQYDHWSFGKQYVREKKAYSRGEMGLAYEIVINSNPCIAYLMEENTMTMQALVIAHACYGHNSFFKNNYLFKQWTDADYIVDYLLFAKRYIKACEEKYGEHEVELFLDSCHALQNYGVDKYKKPRKLSVKDEKERQGFRAQVAQEQINDLWKTLPKTKKEQKEKEKLFPSEPQENILYFIEKNAPMLEPWQREIVRITRKIAQYFYPQRQTQVMNEGWASFTHYNIMNDLFDEGLISQGSVIEFLNSHSGVTRQYDWDDKRYHGMNVYALGYGMMTDIKRICEHPTDEDKEWFPDIAGSNWLKTLHYAVDNFRDESFIQQYLSPALIRKMRLFTLADSEKDFYKVTDIQNTQGYKNIRNNLAKQYMLNAREPDIQVYRVDKDGDRTLYLRHYIYNNIPLSAPKDMLQHIHRLWGYDVVLESVGRDGGVKCTYRL